MFDDESEMMKSREAEINARTDAKIESQNKKLDPESGQTFGEAFKNAKGQKTFMWRGKKYARVTADEKNKVSVKDIVKRADLGPSKMLQETLDKAGAKKKGVYGNSGDPESNKSPIGEMLKNLEAARKARTAERAANSASVPAAAPSTPAAAPARNPGAMSMDAFKPIKSKGYAKGGSVRGAGCATKGVKKCKIR